jgi:hypothetical protein
MTTSDIFRIGRTLIHRAIVVPPVFIVAIVFIILMALERLLAYILIVPPLID